MTTGVGRHTLKKIYSAVNADEKTIIQEQSLESIISLSSVLVTSSHLSSRDFVFARGLVLLRRRLFGGS